jgi:hypothetical protein
VEYVCEVTKVNKVKGNEKKSATDQQRWKQNVIKQARGSVFLVDDDYRQTFMHYGLIIATNSNNSEW